MQASKELITLLDEAASGKTYDLNSLASREQLGAAIHLVLKDVKDLGVIAGPDEGLMNAAGGDMKSLFNPTQTGEALRTRLHQLKIQTQQSTANTQGKLGIIPAQLVSGYNKKGKLIPQYLMGRPGTVFDPRHSWSVPYSATATTQAPVK